MQLADTVDRSGKRKGHEQKIDELVRVRNGCAVHRLKKTLDKPQGRKL